MLDLRCSTFDVLPSSHRDHSRFNVSTLQRLNAPLILPAVSISFQIRPLPAQSQFCPVFSPASPPGSIQLFFPALALLREPAQATAPLPVQPSPSAHYLAVRDFDPDYSISTDCPATFDTAENSTSHVLRPSPPPK